MATTEQRLAEYEDLFKKSQAYDMNKYQQDFQKAYNEAMNYNKDLIAQKSASLGELQAVAPTMRERYSSSLITDPTRQMSLIAQARQAPITDWGQAVDLLSARGAKYSDILGKALGGYQTAAEQANTAAENAWRLYQDAVAQQEAARARAARAGGGINLADLLGLGGGATAAAGEEIYEIPEGGAPLTKEGLIANPTTWVDRLANQVLQQRKATGLKDVVKAYSSSTLEPYRNIKSINDVLSIPSRMGSVYTTMASDIFNRLFKK